MAYLLSLDMIIRVAELGSPEDAHQMAGVNKIWKQALDTVWLALLRVHHPVSNYMDLQPPVDARAIHALFCRRTRHLRAGSRTALHLDDYSLAVEMRAEGLQVLSARLVREAGRAGTFSADLEVELNPKANLVAWAGRRSMGPTPEVRPIFASSEGNWITQDDEYLEATFPLSAAAPRVAWTDAVVGQGLVFDDNLESTPRLCVDRDEISLIRMSVLPGSKVELYMMRVHPQSGDLQAMGDEEMATFINMKLCGL